jgi:hypothetical protein
VSERFVQGEECASAYVSVCMRVCGGRLDVGCRLWEMGDERWAMGCGEMGEVGCVAVGGAVWQGWEW